MYVEGCLVTPNNGHLKQISEKSQKEVKRVLKKKCMHTYIHREILETIYGKMLMVVIIGGEVTCDFYFKIIKI